MWSITNIINYVILECINLSSDDLLSFFPKPLCTRLPSQAKATAKFQILLSFDFVCKFFSVPVFSAVLFLLPLCRASNHSRWFVHGRHFCLKFGFEIFLPVSSLFSSLLLLLLNFFNGIRLIKLKVPYLPESTFTRILLIYLHVCLYIMHDVSVFNLHIK